MAHLHSAETFSARIRNEFVDKVTKGDESSLDRGL